MKFSAAVLAVAASLSICEASTIVLPRDPSPEKIAAEALAVSLSAAKRALPNSPSGGYSPAAVSCPANRPTIREASSLSPNETAWLEIRRNNTVAPMTDWLSRMNISGFDAASYINKVKDNATTLPNIGISMSGGGYRALMNGAGFLAAADNRTRNSTNTGQIGGLLQASTYLTGLSGGGWLVGSIYSNNFSTVESLRDGSSGSDIWRFDNSIFEGPNGNGIRLLSTADYWTTLYNEVTSKATAGFNTTLTDYWGRALSFQLINAADGGPSFTFSSIALTDNFKAAEIPFPILVADSRAPGTVIVSLNSTVYEFNPFELGSWDPTTYAFAPLQYLGSKFSGGVIPPGEDCVEGFDQAGFVMGTSSTLFNEILLGINSGNSTALNAIPSFLRDIFVGLLDDLGERDDDIANYQPNPFFGYNNNTSRVAQSAELTLVDGGEDLQNIPLYPLIQPSRHVDVIFAVDSSADTTFNWPNGTAMVATYQRSLNQTIENGTAFPSIPDQNTFVNLGLNNHPTFFGCDASNITGPAPLVVYIPNAPYITPSNVSTYNLSYTESQRNLIIQNGYEVATLGNSTLDPEWPACMACAVLSRSFTKTGTTVPKACENCFDRYCWNGTLNSTDPSGNYTPPFKIGEIRSAASGVKVGAWITFVTLGVAVALL